MIINKSFSNLYSKDIISISLEYSIFILILFLVYSKNILRIVQKEIIFNNKLRISLEYFNNILSLLFAYIKYIVSLNKITQTFIKPKATGDRSIL